MGSLMIISLRVYYWVWRWKNFENRSTYGEVMSRSRVTCFFTAYNRLAPHYPVLCTAALWARAAGCIPADLRPKTR